MNIQNSRIQIKYSTIAGEVPTIPPSMDHTDGTWSPSDIYIGEFFCNVVDNTLFTRTLSGIIPLSSGTTTIDITAFVNLSGGTMYGTLNTPAISATTITATTINATTFNGSFVGDGSGLTGLTNTLWTGGTVSGPSTFLSDLDLCSASVSASTISGCGGDLQLLGNVEVVGSLSATTYYGNGSNLTNLPYFSAVTLDNVLTQGDVSPNGNIALTNGDITLSNGSFIGDGSGLYNLPPSNIPTLDDVLASGNTSTNGDILLTNGDIYLGTGTFYGDGSGLSGITVDVVVTDGFWTSGSTGTYSIKGYNDTAIDATGNYAYAEGSGTTASGIASHAEGGRTFSYGQFSHAEGENTIASGTSSLAMLVLPSACDATPLAIVNHPSACAYEPPAVVC